METIALDVFEKLKYEQFVPSTVLAQRNNLTKNALLLGGIIVVAIVVIAIIDDIENKKYERQKINSTETKHSS